ncbi:DUF6266 family protein [Pedobacter hartonius]|uniref:Uncharacterized protein n=1 Tax=Pedobacter hartonius TaxID=425514 RepID=A0A1H4G8N0_9SPHI|nr:DUF6266 family protein [Pedobacter hartonius]SEB05924.1 hypothetical protein SAMN05443550_109119 [Pedobacter hartonius]
MATLRPGSLGTLIGRVGNMVFYELNGKIVGRTIGVVDSYSDAQLGNQMGFGLTTLLLNPVNQFIRAGFKTTPKEPGWNFHSLAFSLNKKNALTGKYPNVEIDFTKVIFSMGGLPLPKNPQVKLAGNCLEFSWEADPETKGNDERDQVMLVAYFPETLQAMTVQSGSPRTSEKHTILLPSFKGKKVIETYIAFISEDRERVSNSVYLGQIIWDNQ